MVAVVERKGYETPVMTLLKAEGIRMTSQGNSPCCVSVYNFSRLASVFSS